MSCITDRDVAAPSAGSDERIYLFVCTGNSCRSPMAEALFNARYADGTRRAESAGLSAPRSSDISTGARIMLNAAGLGDFVHTPRNVSEEHLGSAYAVIGLTGRHAAALAAAFPEYAEKITCMPFDIPDPYGGDEAVYKRCFEMIGKALEKMLESNDENN